MEMTGRVLRLIHFLSHADRGNPASIQELAEFLGMHTRSAFRYVEAIEAVGIPVHKIEGHFGPEARPAYFWIEMQDVVNWLASPPV
jgi:predicted DNA-binding transcriptional regulator YafY